MKTCYAWILPATLLVVCSAVQSSNAKQCSFRSPVNAKYICSEVCNCDAAKEYPAIGCTSHIENNTSCGVFALSSITFRDICEAVEPNLYILGGSWLSRYKELNNFVYSFPVSLQPYHSAVVKSNFSYPVPDSDALALEVGIKHVPGAVVNSTSISGSLFGLRWISSEGDVWLGNGMSDAFACFDEPSDGPWIWCTSTILLTKPRNLIHSAFLPPLSWVEDQSAIAAYNSSLYELFDGQVTTATNLQRLNHQTLLPGSTWEFELPFDPRATRVLLHFRCIDPESAAMGSRLPEASTSPASLTIAIGSNLTQICKVHLNNMFLLLETQNPNWFLQVKGEGLVVALDISSSCTKDVLHLGLSSELLEVFSLTEIEALDSATSAEFTSINWLYTPRVLGRDAFSPTRITLQRVHKPEAPNNPMTILLEHMDTDTRTLILYADALKSITIHASHIEFLRLLGLRLSNLQIDSTFENLVRNSSLSVSQYAVEDFAIPAEYVHGGYIQLKVIEIDSTTGISTQYNTSHIMKPHQENSSLPVIDLVDGAIVQRFPITEAVHFLVSQWDNTNGTAFYVQVSLLSSPTLPAGTLEICAPVGAIEGDPVCAVATQRLIVPDPYALLDVRFPHVGRYNVSVCTASQSVFGECNSPVQVDMYSGCPTNFQLPEAGTLESQCIPADQTLAMTIEAVWSHQCTLSNNSSSSTAPWMELKNCSTTGEFDIDLVGRGLFDTSTLQVATEVLVDDHKVPGCQALLTENVTALISEATGYAASSIADVQAIRCSVGGLGSSGFLGFRNQVLRVLLPTLATEPHMVPTVSFQRPSLRWIRGCSSALVTITAGTSLEHVWSFLEHEENSVHAHECDRRSGERVQVFGSQFGLTGALVLLGGRPCLESVHDPHLPHAVLYCTLPQGSGHSLPLSVVAGNQVSGAHNQSLQVSYQECGPGEYLATTLHCLPCGAGSFSLGSFARSCTPAPPGYYVDTPGAKQATPCAPGHHSPRPGARACLPCVPGTYAARAARASCEVCDPGTWTGTHGSTACSECPSGSYSVPQPAGNGTARDHCEPCPAGVYGDVPGLSSPSCAGLCPPGAYCPRGTAAPQGVQCPRGTYNPLPGAQTEDQCRKCPVGRFRSKSGGTTVLDCEECPGASKTVEPGATDIQECLCVQGTQRALDQDAESEGVQQVSFQEECVLCPVAATFSILDRLTTPASKVGRQASDCKSLFLNTTDLDGEQGETNLAWSISGHPEVVVNTGFWKPLASSTDIFQCDMNLPYWAEGETRRFKRFRKVLPKFVSKQILDSKSNTTNSNVTTVRQILPESDIPLLAAISDQDEFCYETGPNSCSRSVALDPANEWETCEDAVFDFLSQLRSNQDLDGQPDWVQRRELPKWESSWADELQFQPYKSVKPLNEAQTFHLLNTRFPAPCTRCRGGLGFALEEVGTKISRNDLIETFRVTFESDLLCGDKYRGGACVACRPPYFKDKDGGRCSVCPTPLFYWGQTLGVFVLLIVVSAIVVRMQISSSHSILAGNESQSVVSQIRKYDKELDRLGFGILDLKGSMFDVMTDSASWPKRLRTGSMRTQGQLDSRNRLVRWAGSLRVAAGWILQVFKALFRPVWSRCFGDEDRHKVVARSLEPLEEQHASETGFAADGSIRKGKGLRRRQQDDLKSQNNNVSQDGENEIFKNESSSAETNLQESTEGTQDRCSSTGETAGAGNVIQNSTAQDVDMPNREGNMQTSTVQQLHTETNTEVQTQKPEKEENKGRRKSRRASASEIVLGASIRFFKRVRNMDGVGGSLVLKDASRLPRDITKQSLVLMVKLTLSYLQVLALLLGTKISWAHNPVLIFMRDFTELVKATASIDSAFLQCVVMPSPEDDKLGYKGYYSLLHLAFVLPVTMLGGIGALNLIGYMVHTRRKKALQHNSLTDNQRVTFKMRFIISSLVVMFLIYIPVILIILTIYECDWYRGAQNPETGQQASLGSFLTAESSIRCYDVEHLMYVKVCTFFVVLYGFGFPFAGCLMIFLHREAIYLPSVPQDSPTYDHVKQKEKNRVLATYGFLFRGYRQHGISLFWEVGPKNLEKVLVLVITVTIPRDRPELLLSLVLAVVGVYGVAVVFVLPFTSNLLFRVEATAQASLFLTACFMVPLTSRFAPQAWAATCTSLVVVINLFASTFITVVFLYLLLLNSRLIDYRAIKSKMRSLGKLHKLNKSRLRQRREVIEIAQTASGRTSAAVEGEEQSSDDSDSGLLDARGLPQMKLFDDFETLVLRREDEGSEDSTKTQEHGSKHEADRSPSRCLARGKAYTHLEVARSQVPDSSANKETAKDGFHEEDQNLVSISQEFASDGSVLPSKSLEICGPSADCEQNTGSHVSQDTDIDKRVTQRGTSPKQRSLTRGELSQRDESSDLLKSTSLKQPIGQGAQVVQVRKQFMTEIVRDMSARLKDTGKDQVTSAAKQGNKSTMNNTMELF